MDTSITFAEVISALLELALVFAIPFVAIYLAKFVRRYLDEARNRMRERERTLLDRAVEVAVKSAEQQGLAGLIPGGAAKKQVAINIAQQYLAEFGLRVDAVRLADLIEAEVLSQFTKPAVATLGPAQRVAVLDRAVELAVLSAEQSGLTGLIRNEGRVKKEYALKFAERYLKEHGIKAELDVVSDMIEAQLIKLLMDARKRVGGAG